MYEAQRRVLLRIIFCAKLEQSDLQRLRVSYQYYRCNLFNSFIPFFLKWALPSLSLDMSTDADRGFSLKANHRRTNSVGPDETARFEPSRLDLHCLHESVLVRRAESVQRTGHTL